jgi:AAA15 family ATPase/GTPase
MLLNFSFKNFGPFKEETDFNLMPLPELENYKHHICDLTGEAKAMRTNAILGANLSGKTSILKAFYALYRIVRCGDFSKIEPFDDKTKKIAPTLFKVLFHTKGNTYQYNLTVLKGKVEKETLKNVSTGKMIICAKDTDSLITGLYYKDNHDRNAAYNWFGQHTFFMDNGPDNWEFDVITKQEEEVFMNLLEHMDFSFKEIRKLDDGDLELVSQKWRQKNPIVTKLSEMSPGFNKIFKLLVQFVAPGPIDEILWVDDLDSGIHPNIATTLVSFWYKYQEYKKQLIFTTNCASFMETLRSDEIFFVDQNIYGTSYIAPFSEYIWTQKHSKAESYLQGRFGGVPVITMRY